MKKLISLVLCLGMLVGILGIVSFAEETELVAAGSEWSYVYYELAEGVDPTPAPEGWVNGTGIESWDVGAAPFADPVYAKSKGNTILVSSFEAYLVKTFTVEDASDIKKLTLSVIYDEDPVVYINGTEVWSAGGYKDNAYTTVDLTDKVDALKDGENVIAVSFRNALGGGGALMDLGLTCDTEIKFINDDGTVVAAGATSEGFGYFSNGLNAPTNVLDGDNNSCSGSGWNPEIQFSITVNFLAKVNLTSVKVSTKNEGAFVEGYDGEVWGTYDVYALDGETATKIGTINADPEGLTVDVADGIEADGVKVVITSWNRTTWAAVADIWAYGTEISAVEPDPTPDTTEPPVDPDPTPVVPDVPTEGTFEGTELTWKLEEGVLTIAGNGAMPDYRDVEDSRPWIESLDKITKVVVKSGVTHVGSSSFTKATAITEVVIEEGVETIGQDAFSYAGTIDTMYLPKSLKAIKQGVVYSTTVTTVNYAGTAEDFAAIDKSAPYNDSIYVEKDGEKVAADGVAYEVTPPTGDATVYAIVFAVVAILGMAVVVTKKVRV